MSLSNAWIQTYTARKFFPLAPHSDEVAIEDIAHALSNLCRFAGHVKSFYSVAQHSVLVSHHCDPEDALGGLLHDASEAYLLDMPRPLKQSGYFSAYLEAEDRLMGVIEGKFGVPSSKTRSVHRADMRVFAAECRDLMSPLHPDFEVGFEPIAARIKPVSPRVAKEMFLDRFKMLKGE